MSERSLDSSSPDVIKYHECSLPNYKNVCFGVRCACSPLCAHPSVRCRNERLYAPRRIDLPEYSTIFWTAPLTDLVHAISLKHTLMQSRRPLTTAPTSDGEGGFGGGVATTGGDADADVEHSHSGRVPSQPFWYGSPHQSLYQRL